MRPLDKRLKDQWPLLIVVASVLALGYSGYWPAIPLPYEPVKTRPMGGGQGLIVEWLMTPNLLSEKASFPPPANLEHYQVRLPASANRQVVSQPQLTRFQDRLFVSWAVHPDSIDGIDQWVAGAWSEDGATWHALSNLFQVAEQSYDLTTGSVILLPSPFQEIEERLFALAHVYEVVGFGDATAGNFATPETNRPTLAFSKPVLESRGYLIREIKEGMTLGPVGWFGQQRPTPTIKDFDESALDAQVAKVVTDKLGTISNRPTRDAEYGTPETWANDGKLLAWPTSLQWDNDLLYRLWTAVDGQEPLYMQTSIDQGRSWSAARPTNVPNAGTMALLGRLPNGPVFLIGNQWQLSRSEPLDNLCISLAFDWLQFTHSYTIRSLEPARSTGSNRSPNSIPSRTNPPSSFAQRLNGLQASSWMLDEQTLWVAYTVNSEAIELSRVPLASLSPLSSESAVISP